MQPVSRSGADRSSCVHQYVTYAYAGTWHMTIVDHASSDGTWAEAKQVAGKLRSTSARHLPQQLSRKALHNQFASSERRFNLCHRERRQGVYGINDDGCADLVASGDAPLAQTLAPRNLDLLYAGSCGTGGFCSLRRR